MPEDADGPSSDTNGKLVLIAEDEHPIADALTYIIADAGHRSITASQGREALEMARAEHPDLIFTDLMMPQMGGAELIRELRADTANGLANVPIVLMSAATGPASRVPGASAMLPKPFDIAQVDALLRRFLGPSTTP